MHRRSKVAYYDALSTNVAEFKDVLPNLEGAKKLGSAFGLKIKEAEEYDRPDRAGRKYHGCVKALLRNSVSKN